MSNEQITVNTPEELLNAFYRYVNSNNYEFDYLSVRSSRQFIEAGDFFKKYPALQAVNLVGFDKDSIADQELALEDAARLCSEIDYSEGYIYFLNNQGKLHVEIYYCSEKCDLADIDSSQYGGKSI